MSDTQIVEFTEDERYTLLDLISRKQNEIKAMPAVKETEEYRREKLEELGRLEHKLNDE